MSKLLVFAVYDSKVGRYAQPFQMLAKGAAIRMFQDLANDPNTTVCKHPHDFTLMELGEYDESTGTFTNHTAPLNLGLAVHFKTTPENQAGLFEQTIKAVAGGQ